MNVCNVLCVSRTVPMGRFFYLLLANFQLPLLAKNRYSTFMERTYDTYITIYFEELKRQGHKEEEVVAIDFDKGCMLFYMTSGDIIRISHPSELSIVDKVVEA